MFYTCMSYTIIYQDCHTFQRDNPKPVELTRSNAAVRKAKPKLVLVVQLVVHSGEAEAWRQLVLVVQTVVHSRKQEGRREQSKKKSYS